MMRFFWVDGRFCWPFVFVVVFIAISALAADFAWRVLVIPFDTLLIYVLLIDAAAAILLIGGYRFLRRRRTEVP